jgi:hypothetical protein
MERQTFYILTMLFIGYSCGQRSGVSSIVADSQIKADTLDLKQVEYIKKTLDVGSKVYKMNCAVCHCGPGSQCDPPSEIQLRYIFDKLPIDSISHYEKYIKNSSLTKMGLRKFPLYKDDSDYEHEFGQTLSDSLIKAVTEYLWLKYRRTD